ncbi:hypothetical protein [Consotaella salsifontis]|uniref:Chemotaxis protein MotC n=1 Tax=Consotaella salsifontis TaxID=1365950 RepID=A0A1T4NRS0_9HYPH|nr:hypothetical protein [Consotaella salsifontis]SJZ81971.1 chemotaxis protein MotC [Consotaella salsifontis]
MTNRSAFAPIATLGAVLLLGQPLAHAEDHATEPTHAVDPAAAGDAATATAHTSAGAETATEAAPADQAAVAEGGATADERGPWKLARPPMPFEIVRSMQFLQDQVARGNGRAIAVQARLLQRFGGAFLDPNPDFWSDPRNLRAAALFALSGGPPAALRGLLGRVNIEGDAKTIIEGALAYVENRQKEAREKLSSLDFRGMEPGLAAHINLALGQIDQLDNPKQAIGFLDRARLLAPGGLIEEAALRLEVLLADQVGQPDKADGLARQYFDRYASSAYADNFRARFAAAYADRPTADAKKTVATAMDITANLDAPKRLSVLLAVARRALVKGNMPLSAEASREAVTFTEAAPPERARALLYSVASTLSTIDYGEGAATLNAIDPTLLQPADRDLRDAAYSVLEQIKTAKTPQLLAGAEPDSASGQGDPSALASRAEQLLKQVSDDLKVKKQ